MLSPVYDIICLVFINFSCLRSDAIYGYKLYPPLINISLGSFFCVKQNCKSKKIEQPTSTLIIQIEFLHLILAFECICKIQKKHKCWLEWYSYIAFHPKPRHIYDMICLLMPFLTKNRWINRWIWISFVSKCV